MLKCLKIIVSPIVIEDFCYRLLHTLHTIFYTFILYRTNQISFVFNNKYIHFIILKLLSSQPKRHQVVSGGSRNVERWWAGGV